MGKSPAFQFYYKDWLSDAKLKMCAHSTKGIWIDVLCLMGWEKTGGIIEGEHDKLMRMVGATKSDFDFFIEEAKRYRFCDISVTGNANEQKNTEIITIKNRRMFLEEKERESNRLRQQKYRSKHKDNVDDNEEVTPYTPSPTPSPTPNSIAKAEKSVPSDNKHWVNKIGNYYNEIRPIRNKLYAIQEEDFFKVDQFIQLKIKQHGHPKGILDALNGLYKKAISSEPPGNWFAYAEKIFKTRSPNYINEDKQELNEFYKNIDESEDMKIFLASLIKDVE